jgi:hypothetical protein
MRLTIQQKYMGWGRPMREKKAGTAGITSQTANATMATSKVHVAWDFLQILGQKSVANVIKV